MTSYKNEETMQSFLTLEKSYKEAVESKKEVFEDLQRYETKYYEVCDERDNKIIELESRKKSWQLQSLKLESTIAHQNKSIEEKDHKITELNEKLKKSHEDYNSKELESRASHNRAVYAEAQLTKLTSLLGKRNNAIESFEIRVEEYQKELSILKTKEVRMKSEIERLEMELSASNSASETLKADSKLDKREIERLNARVSDLEHELERLKAKCEKLKNTNDSLHYSESKLKASNNEAQQQIIKMRNRIIELEKDLDLARNKPAEKSYEVISVDNVQSVESGTGDLFDPVDTAELERANRKIKELEDLLHQYEVENSELKASLGQSKGQITKMECELENAHRHKSIGAAELEGERGKLARLRAEIKHLTEQLEASEKTVENLRKSLVKKDKLMDDLKEKMAGYDKIIADREEDIFTLNGKYEYVILEKEKLQEENRDLAKRLGDLEADVKISQDDNEKVSIESRGLYRKISELEAKLSESDKDRRYYEDENAKLQHRIDSLDANLLKVNQEKSVYESQTADLSNVSNRHRDDAVLSKKELMELRGEVDGLRKELLSKETTIKTLRDKVDDQNEDLYEAKRALEDSNLRFKTVEDDIKKLEHNIELKNAEIDRLNGILDRTTKERNDAEIQLAGLLEKFKSLNTGTGKTVSVRPTFDINITKVQDLEAQLSTLRQKLYTVERDNDTQKQQVNFLKNEIIERDDRISHIQRELDSRGIHDDEAEKLLADYKNKCWVLEKELSELTGKKEIMEEELTSLRPTVGKLEAKGEALSLKKETLSSQLQENSDKLRLAKDDLHNAEMEIMEERKANTSLGKMVKKHELTIDDLKLRLKNTESELEKVGRHLSESRFENDSLRARNKEQENLIAELKAHQADLEREIGDLRDHREVIEGDLSAMSYKLSNLNVKVGSIEKDKSYYQTDSEASQTKLRRLKNDLIQANNQIRDKERMIDDLNSKCKDLESDYTALKRKNKSLEDDINSIRKELESEKHANDVNREKINELLAKLEESASYIQAPVNVNVVESAPTFFQEPAPAEPDGRLEELEALYQSSKDRESSLRHDIEQRNYKITQIENEKRRTADRCSELEHELSMLQRKYHDQEQSLHRSQRERDDFKKDSIEATNKWSFYEQKAENEEAERRSLQKQYDDAMRKLRESQEEILKAEENIVEHRLAVNGLMTEQKYQDEHLKKLRESHSFSESQKRSLNDSLSYQREENEKLKDERNGLLELNLTKENTINRLKADNQVLSKERDRLNEDMKDLLERFRENERKLAESNRRLDQSADEIEDQNTEIHSLKDQLTLGQRKYKDLELKIQKLNDDAEKEERYTESLRENKKELEDTIADLKRQLAEQSNQVTVIRPAEVQHVQAVVESAPVMDFGDSDEIKRLQDENIGLKKRIKEGESVIERNNRLSELIAEGEGKLAKMEAKVQYTESRNEDLEKELSALKKEAKPMMEKYDATVRDYEITKDQLDSVQSTLGNTQIQLDQEKSLRIDYRRQLDEKIAELDDRENELLDLKKRLKELEALLNASNDSIAKDHLVEMLRNESDSQKVENESLRRELTSIQGQLNDLYRKKQEVDKRFFKLKEENANLEIENEKLKKRIEDLGKSLKEADDRVSEVEEILKEFKKEKANLKASLNEANNRIKKDKAEIAIDKRKIAELQEIIDSMKGNTLDFQQQAQTSNQDDALIRCKNKVEKYRKDLQRSQDEISRLQLLLRDKETRISGVNNSDSLVKENARLKNALRDQKAESEQYRQNYSSSQREIEKIQLNVITLNQEKNNLQAKVDALEGDKTVFKRKESETAKDISSLKIQIDTLKHEKSRLQNDLTILNKKYDNVVSQLTSLQSKKGRTKDTINIKKMNELESKYHALLREKEEAKNETLAHRKNHARAENALSEQLKNRQALEHEITLRENRISEAISTAKEAQEKHLLEYNKCAELRKENQGLKQDIQNLEHRNDRLLKQKAGLEKTVDELNDDLRESERRIDSLEASMNETDDESDGGYGDHVKAQTQISELEARLRRTTESLTKATKDAQMYKSQLWDLQDDVARLKNEIEHQRTLKEETNKMNDKLKEDFAQLKKDTWEAQQNYNNVIMESTEHKYNKELLESEKGDLDKQIRRLHEEVADNVSQKEVVTSERNELRFQVQRLQVDIAQANMEATEAREQLEQLEAERAKLSHENEHLKNKLNSQEVSPIQVATVETVESELPFNFDEYDGAIRDRDQLKLEKEGAESRLRQLDDELRQYRKDKDHVENNLVDARKVISQLETENKNLITARDNAKYETDISNQKYIEQRTDNESLKQEKESLLLELKELRPKISELEARNEQLERRVQSLDRQVSSTQRPIKTKTKRDDSELQRVNVGLQKELTELKIALKSADETAYQAEKEKEETEKKNALIREDMIFYQSKCEKLEEEYKSLELRLREREDEVKDLLEKLGTSSDSGRLSLTESERMAKLNSLEKRIAYLERLANDKDEEIARLREKIQKSGKEEAPDIQIHLSKIMDKSEVYRRADKEKAEIIESLKAQNTSLEIELEGIKKEVEIGRLSATDYRKENEDLEDEVDALNAEKIAAENKIAEEANRYKLTISDLENEKRILVDQNHNLGELVVKYESQIQELREKQAIMNNEASTTLIMEVDKKQRSPRPHSMYVSYAEGEMMVGGNRPRVSTSESYTKKEETETLNTTSNSTVQSEDLLSSTKKEEPTSNSYSSSSTYTSRYNYSRDEKKSDRERPTTTTTTREYNRGRDTRDRDSYRTETKYSSTYSSRDQKPDTDRSSSRRKREDKCEQQQQ